jgi:hypothetical protein
LSVLITLIPKAFRHFADYLREADSFIQPYSKTVEKVSCSKKA